MLITTEAGLHFVSVVPYPHRLSFTELDQATNIALQWARANHVTAWRTLDGETVKVKQTKDTTAARVRPSRNE